MTLREFINQLEEASNNGKNDNFPIKIHDGIDTFDIYDTITNEDNIEITLDYEKLCI